MAAPGRLTPARVIDAAVALADREGVEALTVRRLAEALGVHPTSLYHHVPSKGAILDGVVELLFVEAGIPEDQQTWQEWVRYLALSFRDLARKHPGAFMVLARRPAETPSAYDMTECGLDAFRRGGFSIHASAMAVRAVSLAALGLALHECPPMGEWVDPSSADKDWTRHPRLQEARQLGIADTEQHWEVLIGALVAGLSPEG